MTESQEELLEIADRLQKLAGQAEDPIVRVALTSLDDAVKEVGKAWSGSWIGYHANVYYSNFGTPPPGEHFSSEWGLDRVSNDTGGDWKEFDPDQLKAVIYETAENPDLAAARKLCEGSRRAFENDKSEILSILTTELAEFADPFLKRLQDDVEKLSILSLAHVISGLRPTGYTSRDSLAMHQGLWTPPHLSVMSEVISLRHPPKQCGELGQLAKRAGSHLSRKRSPSGRAETIGANVFIGHGGSQDWRELKDFIQDRLRLPWDEFNRVPVAGVTNVARLLEMLDSAAVAFLVMTGEDEQTDGKLHARMSVVHEAGLFQGRLGFARAIIVLEEGCEEFSNIEGLGQIRFPKGNIGAAFDKVRHVLEREGIIGSD